MKVRKMIEMLQKQNPDAEVKMHGIEGNNALFVVARVGNDDIVYIEDKDDSDLSSELEARFEYALEHQLDELDFFMDLLDTGFVLDDIEEYLPEQYEYSKKFMKEHGLI